MSDQVYLMTAGFIDAAMAGEYASKHPETKQEIEKNLKSYGVPFLSGKIGWMKRNEVGRAIGELLEGDMKSQLLELLVFAHDERGDEYAIQYDVLRTDGRDCIEKAVAYEERVRRYRGENHEGRKG